MADRDYKAFIVEGEVREPMIINNISKIFFAHGNFKIIALPVGENIYMLWKKLQEDDFDTDIIEVLRESSVEIREQLSGLSRDDFSEVYLFFDYDAHQMNLGRQDSDNVIKQMLESFDNETENGKLYISYPMVEALRDFEPEICGNKENCFVALDKMEVYKDISSVRSFNPQFKKYSFVIWQHIIDVFAMRLSCLMDMSYTLDYEQYSEKVNPYEVQALEEKEVQKGRVFVLSAFPQFLIDYFGIKLWKKCVKHEKNKIKTELCNKN